MLTVKTEKQRLISTSDERFECGQLIRTKKGVQTVYEFPFVDNDKVKTALLKQKTGLDTKFYLFGEWKNFQRHVKVFLEKAEGFASACTAYAAEKENFTTIPGWFEPLDVICKDAEKYIAMYENQGTINDAMHLVIQLQAFPGVEYPYQLREDEDDEVISALVIDVELVDGTILKSCLVYKEDEIEGKRYVNDEALIDKLVTTYPYGEAVNPVHLKGLKSKIQVTVEPSSIKRWERRWEYVNTSVL
ncbi:hypothetical protein [Bacillus sp. NEAU-Y102]